MTLVCASKILSFSIVSTIPLKYHAQTTDAVILAPNFQTDFSSGKSTRTNKLFIWFDIFFDAQVNGATEKTKKLKNWKYLKKTFLT